MSASINFRSVWHRLALVTALPLAAAACRSDSLKPEPVAEPSDVYWDLQLDKHAVTLSTAAPYDTITVTATPRNYQQEPLAGLSQPQFVSSDPSVVDVTSDGVLIARAASNAFIQVVATLTAGNLKHADTMNVRVVDNPSPPILETLSLEVVPPDSAKWASSPPSINDADRLLTNLVHVTYAGGVVSDSVSIPTIDLLGTVWIPDVLVSLRSSDTTIGVIDDGRTVSSQFGNLVGHRLRGIRHGEFDIYASATVFGVTKADTLHFRIGYPLQQQINLTPVDANAQVNTFSLPSPIIGVGGTAWWFNNTSTATEIVFSDSAKARSLSDVGYLPPSTIDFYCSIFPYLHSDCTATGNFVSLAGSINVRMFNIPGVYEYHSAEGQTARIVVGAE